ncbi:hypothetical protein FJY71_00830 [candidate division WOR-3 bacterium]|nr:hypothetical protein [candidate division WOR-3 bacterium]
MPHPALILSAACCLLTSAFACTIGAFSPLSTADSVPILWKNRDVDNPDQEMRFFSGGRYRFVANVYAGESLDVWAGINEAGFGIMNSNSYNLGGDLDGPDDGNVMRLALAGCAALGDFDKLMDSLNVVGRTTPANYGVFDSTGATAIYEASNTFYTPCDAAADSHNLTLRANYSFSGDTIRLRGRNRWLRAMQLAVPARQSGSIGPRWVTRTLSRDLGQVGFDPYPLPFHGRFGKLDSGFLPTDSTICRRTTRSLEVVVGRRPGCPAGSGMMWVLIGAPDVSLPVPLWVAAGTVPAALNGPLHAALCDEAARVHDYVHSDPEFPDAVNTRALTRVLRFFAPTESAVFALVDSAVSTWPGSTPAPGQAIAVSESACALALAAYAGFWEMIEGEKPVPVPPGETIPAFARGEVSFRLPPGLSGARLDIYDVAGRRVAVVLTRRWETVTRWSPVNLRSGSYFVRFADPRVSRAFRLTYLR